MRSGVGGKATMNISPLNVLEREEKHKITRENCVCNGEAPYVLRTDK